MSDTSLNFLPVARDLGLQAAETIMSLREGPLEEQRKADKSLVTVADLNADKLIREGLSRSFPTHGILTEENGIVGNAAAEYVWLIDPLDGTKAYAKGIPGFSVMIGLLRNGEPCLGVVVDPIKELLYEAVAGEGAFLTHKGERKAIQVSQRADAALMPLVVSTGFPDAALAKIKAVFSPPIVDPINSVGIKVGCLVRQEADVYLNHHPVHLWDTCAPQMILEEAGGTFTQIDGSPLKYELKPPYSHGVRTMASNGTRHQEWVEMVEREKLFE